jgi:hypothetical protein
MDGTDIPGDSTRAIGALPPNIFAADDDEFVRLGARHADPTMLTLARRNIPLNISEFIPCSGGNQIFDRLRRALLTFDAAAVQDRDNVACILYVVAAESLSVPNAPWRLSKVTNRFVSFFENLVPAELDAIIAHANFEQAFGIRRGQRTARALRKELLNYPMGFGAAPIDGARRVLFADFAEAAILRYIQSPHSSLIGHPQIEVQGQ